MFSKMHVARLFIGLAVAALFSNSVFAQDRCADILRHGVWDYKRVSSKTDLTKSFVNWFCRLDFKSAKDVTKYSRSLEFVYDMMPVKASEHYDSEKWRESYEQSCSRREDFYRNISSYDLEQFTVNSQIVDAWTKCTAGNGLFLLPRFVADEKLLVVEIQWNSATSDAVNATRRIESLRVMSPTKDGMKYASCQKGDLVVRDNFIVERGVPLTATCNLPAENSCQPIHIELVAKNTRVEGGASIDLAHDASCGEKNVVVAGCIDKDKDGRCLKCQWRNVRLIGHKGMKLRYACLNMANKNNVKFRLENATFYHDRIHDLPGGPWHTQSISLIDRSLAKNDPGQQFFSFAGHCRSHHSIDEITPYIELTPTTSKSRRIELEWEISHCQGCAPSSPGGYECVGEAKVLEIAIE
jgi:hypothetical protein